MGKFIPRTPQQKEWVRIADKFILEHLPHDFFEDGAKFRRLMLSMIQRHIEKTAKYYDYDAVLFICAHFWINHFKRDWESFKITHNESTKMSLEALERENLVAQENSDLILSEDQKNRLHWNYILEYAISTLEHPENLHTISQKEHSMNTITTNPSAAIETRIIIFGQDAATMTEQQLIDAIKRVEGDIAKLKEVKTKSKKIAANIYDLETQLNAIVAVLDER